MRSWRTIVSLVGVMAVIAVWVALSAASPRPTTPTTQTTTPTTQTAETNRAQAIRVADQMLDQLVLPAGATQLSAAPKLGGNFLDGPFDRFLVASQVDRSRVWTVRGSPKTVVAFIAAHLPASARSTGDSSGGSELQDSYRLATISPRTLGARQLVLAAVGSASGESVIRADAEIRYVAPRPADERIPGTARVLDITVGSDPSHPSLALRITRVAEVTRIADIANALPLVGNEQGLSFNCPAEGVGAPVDRFVFRGSAGGPVLASVTALASETTADDPCSSTSLIIRGHREPALQDGGILIQRAGALLHVRLSR